MSPCHALERGERLPQHPGLRLAGGARGARGEAHEGGVGADGVEAHEVLRLIETKIERLVQQQRLQALSQFSLRALVVLRHVF